MTIEIPTETEILNQLKVAYGGEDNMIKHTYSALEAMHRGDSGYDSLPDAEPETTPINQE
jgi:hypothetical protein